MTKFEKVKDYFDKGLWNKEQVKKSIGKWITEEEYNEIVKTTYFG